MTSSRFSTSTPLWSAGRSRARDPSSGALKPHDSKMPFRLDKGDDEVLRSHRRAALRRRARALRAHVLAGASIEHLRGVLSPGATTLREV